MKRISVLFVFIVAAILFVACSNNRNGTYYPNIEEMQSNLAKEGYQVQVKSIQTDEYSGTYLIAENNDDYMEFYWLDEIKSLSSLETELKEKYPDYEKLVCLENDSEYGSLIFCSTEKAMNNAGIRIVDVKVKI